MRVVVLFLLASVVNVAWSQDLVPRGELFGPFEMVRVVDGERFVIDLPDYDETVRLVGLDVRGQSDAAVILGRLLSGRGVWLEVTDPPRDVAGNIQGYAYVLDGQGRWSYKRQRFSQVNRLLGGQGYAGLGTTNQNVFSSSNRTSVSVPPSVATIDVSRIGERAPTPLSFDEARLRRVGAPQRQGRLNLRLLGDTMTGMPITGTMTGTMTGTPTRRITTTVTTTTTTTDDAGTTRVITGTARSCQDFASWDDAQAFGSQLPLNQRAAFDEDGDGVFCEVLLLERRCDSFASWEDAQAFLETLAPNSASARQLDGDGDGVACEALLIGSTPTSGAAPRVSVNVTTNTPNTNTPNATTTNSGIMDLSASPNTPASSATPMVSARHASNCIDLNQASLSELSHLAGVTLFRADQIVRNRPYALVSDLARLPGFSAQMIANIDAQGLACVR